MDSNNPACTVKRTLVRIVLPGKPLRIPESQSSPEPSAVGSLQRVLELDVHSFIVKVWLEETNQSGRVIWRGHITQVPGGERIYVRELSDITAFIAPYLYAMGVSMGIRQRIKKWLWP